ncbi:MAG TPA: SDR family NAD(P)-dependent oxidoreductase, partial [Gemmatimonadaceae bacterium]|nr:SDR family NAD(P)-dependent oxidoreductase [Gemmatimonadaceae bacterium]
ILGPCKVMSHEFHTIRCQSVDIDLAEATDELLERVLIDSTMDTESGTFAYRAGHRWVQTFEPMPLAPRAGVPARLREHGVYFITGGLGGLGLVVAKYLAETVHAKLVLTGRSGLPPRAEWPHWLTSHEANDATSQRIQAVQELEALGAEVLTAQADVSDREAMTRAVAQARQQFGTVHGVFHAAGLPGGMTMHLHLRDNALKVLAPKVHGTLILDALFQGADLDCMVLFSSINALVGFGSSTDYTAANLFLDSYAAAHYTPARPVLSINWDTWQDVGMAAVRASSEVHGRGVTMYHAMTPQEGIEALRRVLSVSVPQVAVITRSLPELIELSQSLDATTSLPAHQVATSADAKLSQHARPDLSQGFVEPENAHERFIANLWQELLGIDRIGIDDDFFELGGHSLIATGLLTRIQKEYQVKLPLRTIFEASTVRELAERVSTMSWATQGAPVSTGEENREEFEL